MAVNSVRHGFYAIIVGNHMSRLNYDNVGFPIFYIHEREHQLPGVSR